MRMNCSGWRLLAGVTMLVLIAVNAAAGTRRFIDDNDTVVLTGNTHPLARSGTYAGAASASLPMERMILSLKIPAGNSAALDGFIKDRHNPASPNYRKWATPEEFGSTFGPSADDIAAVTGWLTSHGFTVNEVSKSGAWINFSGDVSSVEQTFKTEIQTVLHEGKLYYANVTDPSIPKGLTDLVAGIVTLHNFPRLPKYNVVTSLPSDSIVPNYTNGTSHFLAPGDFAAIYDVGPLYTAGVNGSGQSIAIVGRTHPPTGNWANFRSAMGLPANTPTVVVNGADPGDLGPGEDIEADLDVEWSGAVAKNATIAFVTSKSTNTTDGVDLSAQYIVEKNLAPVLSMSFGSCESDMGTTENSFYNSLWSQAAAQGITVVVASGDSGAAGCSSANGATGAGKGVNGIAATPYNVAVGGTAFNEGTGRYWNSVSSTTDTSVLGYIPEVAWNESGTASGGSDLWASGGGASALYAKPSWQSGVGVPEDGKRDVPDVALSAAGHDAYMVMTGGALVEVGGTSAAAPSFAGLMSLVGQKTGQRQGNANVTLYQLATRQYAAKGANVFHDIVLGNNSVPGVPGFAAGTGYDQVTGLGSVDASVMVSNWEFGSLPGFSLSAAAAISVAPGHSGSVPIQVTAASGFSSSVTLTVAGLPSGVTAAFTPASLAAPGSGASALTVIVTSAASPGTQTLTVTATGGGVTESQTVAVTILPPPGFAVAAIPALAIVPGKSATVPVQITGASGFSAAVALTVTGLPPGVTAAFSPATVAAPGSGLSALTIAAASTATPGTLTLTVMATGGGVTHSQTLSCTVLPAPNFTLAVNSPALGVSSGKSATVSLQITATSGFSASVALSVTGLTTGITASLSPATIAAPGSGSSALTLSVASTVATGVHTLTVTATGGGVTRSETVELTVTPPPGFTMTAIPALSVVPGKNAAGPAVQIITQSGFAAGVTLTVTGLPSGVTATFSPATLASPGSGMGNLTVVAASTAVTGTYTVTFTATGGGVTHSETAALTVLPVPGFTLAALPALSVTAGKSATESLQISVTSTFTAQIALAVTGLPSGVTVALVPAAASGQGESLANFAVTAAATAAAGIHTVTVTATGGGVTHSQSFPLTVVAPSATASKLSSR